MLVDGVKREGENDGPTSREAEPQRGKRVDRNRHRTKKGRRQGAKGQHGRAHQDRLLSNNFSSTNPIAQPTVIKPQNQETACAPATSGSKSVIPPQEDFGISSFEMPCSVPTYAKIPIKNRMTVRFLKSCRYVLCPGLFVLLEFDFW